MLEPEKLVCPKCNEFEFYKNCDFDYRVALWNKREGLPRITEERLVKLNGKRKRILVCPCCQGMSSVIQVTPKWIIYSRYFALIYFLPQLFPPYKNFMLSNPSLFAIFFFPSMLWLAPFGSGCYKYYRYRLELISTSNNEVDFQEEERFIESLDEILLQRGKKLSWFCFGSVLVILHLSDFFNSKFGWYQLFYIFTAMLMLGAGVYLRKKPSHPFVVELLKNLEWSK